MTTQRFCRLMSVLVVLVTLVVAAGTAWTQSGSQGTISITVLDASGGAVPGTALQLVDLGTNYVRKAVTHENGEYTFVNLTIGSYKLTAAHPGYATTVTEHVDVHAAMTTDVTVALKVGASSESIQVIASATPLVESSSNVIGMVVDLKQIEDLPLGGRDLTALSRMTPGYSGTSSMGEWNGQPLISQGSNLDGTIGESSRMKIFGNIEPAVTPRIEDIEEMTVQTDQLDLDQGFGQAVMQANFVTRRGTNKFHGRAFQNFHNGGLNANSWNNDLRKVRKPKNIFNDFGGSVGGPIFKDKLFFFASMAMQKVPGGFSASDTYLNADAEQGKFTYTGMDGKPYTRNVLDIVNSYSGSLTHTVNSEVAAQLALINTALSSGTASADSSDPNLGDISWYNENSTSQYFPSGRLDYDATDKLRMSLSWTMTYFLQPGVNPSPFPGKDFSNMLAGNKTKNYTASYGVDWTVSPRLINQFKFGFLYDVSAFGYNAAPLYATKKSVNWAVGTSGQSYQEPVTSYYPAFNVSDSATLERSSHTLKLGFTGYREQDHYWNGPSGFPVYQLGMASGDPAANAFSLSQIGKDGKCDPTTGTLPCATVDAKGEAESLYATLAGRISGVSGTYAYNAAFGGYKPAIGSYALDEVTMAWGLYAQDSWRIKPSLTLNYGLRWDFTGESQDKSGLYHEADPSSIFGPTAEKDLFKPGAVQAIPIRRWR